MALQPVNVCTPSYIAMPRQGRKAIQAIRRTQ
jgi:hypothetical protein